MLFQRDTDAGTERVTADETRRMRISEMIKAKTADLIAAGPEACRAYLVELGTHRPDGSLTPEYGGEPNPVTWE